jgi:hypothetical protein
MYTYAPNRKDWTERHLRDVAKIQSGGAAYIERMQSCRATRPCNLHACPFCWSRAEERRRQDAKTMFAGYPRKTTLTIDILLPPRDRLIDSNNNPLSDVRLIRRALKSAFGNLPNGSVTLIGRYEVEAKRARSTGFLKQHASNCTMSRVVVPHLHAVAVVMDAGRHLATKEVAALLAPHFPGIRQIKIGRLHRGKSAAAAFSSAVGYAFKGQTNTFTGRALQDYVRTQMSIRKDAWVIKIRKCTDRI